MHDALAASLDDLAILSPDDALARIAEVRARVQSCSAPEVLQALARAMPAKVATLAPEVALALHGVAEALATQQPRLPDDIDALPMQVRVAWLRLDEARLASLDDAMLLRVVTAPLLARVAQPLPVLARMIAARDVRLRMQALASLRPLVEALAITGAEASDCVAGLAQDDDPMVREAALRALAWQIGLAPAAEMRRRHAIEAALRDARFAPAAIAAASELGARAWLAERLSEIRTGDGAEAIIAALGPLANADDLGLALAIAAEDPLRFGPAARSFVLAAHRHGAFVRAPQLDAVLALFDAHAAWTADELARATYVVRDALRERLAALPADDDRWRRRAGVLAATDGAPVLAAQLAATTRIDIAVALIDAAGRAPAFDDEAALLAWLERAPEAVLPVLRAKGGAASVARLRALVSDPLTSRTLRRLAMPVLWALEPDRPALQRALAAQLGLEASGLLESRYLRTQDPSAAQLLAAHDARDVSAEDQLAIYAEAGDLALLPELTAAFRAVYRRHVQRALDGDFTVKRLMLPELEQRVFRFGRHVVADGRPVRRWLADAPETGRDLVLRLACEWLAERPSEAIQVALLETIARHAPDAAILRQLAPFWRRGPMNVRRAALEALTAAGEAARGLELSLGKLASEAGAPRIQAAALETVRALRATWAEPIVRAALEQPEMAVKQAAAEALGELGDARSVPALVAWLARHDNAALRGHLSRALDRAAGEAYVAVIVDALARAEDPRSRELLIDALDNRIPLAAVLRLARRAAPGTVEWHVVEACLDGDLAMRDARPWALADALHRADQLPAPQPPDPDARLRREGFSIDAARALAALPRKPAPVAAVRLAFASWVSWLASAPRDDEMASALALVLDAAEPAHHAWFGGVLDAIDRHRARLAPHGASLARFFAACATACTLYETPYAMRAIAALRATPPSPAIGGLARWRWLGELEAVRTLDDLEACLAECRISPDVTNASFTLLSEALAIPAPRDDEPAAITALRDAARDDYRHHDPRWLADAVAQHPIDLPAPPLPPAPPAKPPFAPHTRGDLAALLATLDGDDAPERERAAQRLLAWPDARDAWPRVRDAYLAGRIGSVSLATLAATIPAEPGAWPHASERAATLVPHLSPTQVRAFLPAWLDAWERGDADAATYLARVGQDALFPFVLECARAGRFRFARLLDMISPAARDALLALAGDDREAQRDLAHLAVPPPPTEAPAGDPVDPIEHASIDGLLAIIEAKPTRAPHNDRGLAVRAVHALTRHGAASVPALERLALDRRPPVRSAALRALRVVAPRERTLAIVADILEIEDRRDVVLSLMASLGHGRHAPSLPLLLERLIDRDPRIRQGAHDAVRAWGRDAVPALHHAARRARPDRRPLYQALLDELA